MIFKDYGIVIKQINFGDYDKILSIVTQNHGKVSAIAKGVRKINSKKAPSCELFVKSKFAFAKGRSLDIITETQPITYFDSLKSTLEKITTLFYISELLDQFIEEGDETQSQEVYQLLDQFLQLCEASKQENLFSLTRGFESRLLAVLGISPDLYHCAKCGNSLLNFQSFRYSSVAGGILCSKCSEAMKDSGNDISVDSLKSLRYFQEQDLSRSELLQLNGKMRSEIKFFNQKILEYFYGLRIKSKEIVLN